MIDLNPQYINDKDGSRSLVVITKEEFDALLEELEDQEDVRLYVEAKKNYTGERIAMDEAFAMIEATRLKDK